MKPVQSSKLNRRSISDLEPESPVKIPRVSSIINVLRTDINTVGVCVIYFLMRLKRVDERNVKSLQCCLFLISQYQHVTLFIRSRRICCKL